MCFGKGSLLAKARVQLDEVKKVLQKIALCSCVPPSRGSVAKQNKTTWINCINDSNEDWIK